MGDLRFQTAEERAAAIDRAMQLQEHGRRPAGPVLPASPVPPLPSAPSLVEDEYDADRDLAVTTTGARPFPMPGGGKVWVHPLSPEQVMWINGQASRHLERLQLKADDPARRTAYRLLAWVYQVIACCRKGPEPAATYVYAERHAEALFRNPRPGHECLQRIVSLCDQLGDDSGQSLSEEVSDFFGATASWLSMWRLRLTTSPGSLSSGLAALEAFERFAARIALQRTLSKSDFAEFPDLPGAEPDPEISTTADTATAPE